MVLVSQTVLESWRYDPHPLKNRRVNWCLEMIEVCVVEVFEMTLNSGEEVREASWRANQGGLGLEGWRMYTLTGKGENMTSTWNHIEPGRARKSMRCQEGIREMTCWVGQGWRAHAWTLGFPLKKRRNHWRSLWTFWQNVSEMEAESLLGSCASKSAESLWNLTKTGGAEHSGWQDYRLWSHTTSPLSTCVTLSRSCNLCASVSLAVKWGRKFIPRSLGHLLDRRCITNDSLCW